ncbi:MAG: tripartite tricarboxylate transporter substrate-binding protein [Burkholderiales bacterium]
MLNTFADVKLTHIPYKAFAQGVPDTMSCKVDVSVGSVAGGLPLVRAGKRKALGITPATRFPGTPDVATMIEWAMPSFDLVAYYGLVTTAGTPRAVVERLNSELVSMLREKETAEILLVQGLLAVGDTPEQFAVKIRDDLEFFAKLAKAINLRVE